MDARHFDALARSVTEMGTRRGLLALLATLPLLGGLFTLLDNEADAKGRRKRRKKRHKHGKGNGRRKNKKKQRCKAHSRAKTCANRCGVVKNTCKKKINCGPCVCDPLCPDCQVCDAATGQCVPDPSQQGDDCGAPGQVCQADGTCACDASSCAPCETCQGDGTCSLPCGGEGCCDDGDCVSGLDTDACGRNGEACVACSGPGVTCGGGGQDGVCGCTPPLCPPGTNCGSIFNPCGDPVVCGPETCTQPDNPCQQTTCETNVCTTGPGHNGATCGQASCADGTVTPAGTCDGGICTPGTPVSCAPYTRCAGAACASSCTSDAECVADHYCDADHQCMPDQPNGQPCDFGGQCQSGFCTDGVCCTAESCPECQGCNVSGMEGACQIVADGATCDDGQHCTIGTCDAGVCVGAPCSGPTPVCNGTDCVSCSAICGTDYCITPLNGTLYCSDTVVFPAGGICGPACTAKSQCTFDGDCAESAYFPFSNNPICRNAPAPGEGLCIEFG